MILSASLALFLSAIALDGVVGEALSARASFDANNVRVGDPMILTIDFVGSAEFRDLHPPALAREVDSKIWKIDDASAKTETYADARRLVYRLRPLREGLFWFPALEFSFQRTPEGADGAAPETRICSTPAIPVHVRAGVQAALGIDEAEDSRAMPDGIFCEVAGLSDDEAFLWRKACNNPTADAFKPFDFPEARLNEAAAAIVEGNWARALRIYSALEWQTGQTLAIERGIAAAKGGELPAWRIALRPLLRHAWPGRVALVLGTLAALALFFWGSSRLIRRLAAFALLAAALPLAAHAQSPFDEIDKLHEQMRQRMNSMMNGVDPFGAAIGQGFSPGVMTINGRQTEPLAISASLAVSTNDVRVGETFQYIVSLECPRGVTLDSLRFTPSEMFGMVATGKLEALPDAPSANPSNRVRRVAIPVRYDVPFKGDVSVRVDGMANRRQQIGNSSFSFSQSFSAISSAAKVEIKPLPTENQPHDFSGAIGTAFKLSQRADRTKVETNDVLTLVRTLEYSGYLPHGAFPGELERRPGTPSKAFAQDYFVADGTAGIEPFSIVWYDTATRTYKTAKSNAIRLEYTAPAADIAEDASVAVDSAQDAEREVKTIVLHFAPSHDSPVVERLRIKKGDPEPVITERRADWVRLDSGSHAGWTPAP